MTKRNAAGWVAVVVAVILYVVVQVAPLLGTRGMGIVGLASHANDYKHLYLGSELLWARHSPYDARALLDLAGGYSQTVDPRFRTVLPYVYLPFTGIVMRPVTALPFAKSVVVWQIVNHLCLLGGMVLLWMAGTKGTPGTEGTWSRGPLKLAGMIMLLVLSVPVFRQNNAGQLNAVLFLGYCVVWLAMVRGWRDEVIGIMAAALMLFKISPGVLLVWFLIRGEWKRAGWMLGAALVLTAACLPLAGIRTHLEFLPMLKQMGYGKSTWSEFGQTFWRDAYNQSINATFHRLFVSVKGSGTVSWTDLGPTVANALTWVAGIAIVGLFIASAGRKGDNLASSYSLAILASLLVPSIMWDHYLVQALVPAVLLWSVATSRWLVVFIGVCVGIMAAPVMFDAEVNQKGIALLVIGSAKLWPVLGLFVVGAVRLLGRNQGASG